MPSTAAGIAVPSGKSAIVAAYINAINTLKSTPNFQLVKTETLNIVLDEITPSSVQSIANKIIESNRKTSPENYRFSGGVDAADGEGVGGIELCTGIYEVVAGGFADLGP